MAGEDDSRSCPRCQCALQKLELAGIVVDLCVSCLGVWFDLGELEKLVKAGREGRLEDDDSLLAHEIREGLDGRDIPPDLLGHLVATIKSFFTSLG